jgi:hypothetical protein
MFEQKMKNYPLYTGPNKEERYNWITAVETLTNKVNKFTVLGFHANWNLMLWWIGTVSYQGIQLKLEKSCPWVDQELLIIPSVVIPQNIK